MAIDYHTLLDWPFDEIIQSYSQRDTMLYALGLGLGSDPLDASQLCYVYERGLKMFPTMPVVLGHPGSWMSDSRTGVNMLKVLHAGQHIEIHKPLPVEGTVLAKNRVVEVVDRGEHKGAYIAVERQLFDQKTGQLCCTQKSVALDRDGGGFGGPRESSTKYALVPDRQPDLEISIPVSTQAALLYRLSGDYNPLHADPDVATRAGFDRPILHGLASFGVAARALVDTAKAAGRPGLSSFGVRFTAPVYPGETITTLIWDEPESFKFQSVVKERNVTILNNGYATF